MSPSSRLAFVRDLNALIHTAFNMGVLAQAELSLTSKHGIVPTLHSSSEPSHPFFALSTKVHFDEARRLLLAHLDADSPPPAPSPRPVRRYCTRCGTRILPGEAFIGDDDGTGQRFAHYRCYTPR